MQVQIKILSELIGKNIPLPEYQTEGAAGLDLRACITDNIEVLPGKTVMIGTGIAIYIADKNYAAMILPRSGLGHKHGIVLGNTVGLIDSDYQGELMVSCWNRSENPYSIAVGQRFAQLIFTKVYQPQFEVVKDFVNTTRGANGFGSTGDTSKKIKETLL